MSHGIYLLAGIGVCLAIAGYFVPHLILPAVVILLLGYYLILGLAKHRDNQQSFEYSEVMDGVRVIGIQPETPAAKMDLKVGDVVLYGKYSGTEIQAQGKEFLMMRQSDIMAIIG